MSPTKEAPANVTSVVETEIDGKKTEKRLIILFLNYPKKNYISYIHLPVNLSPISPS